MVADPSPRPVSDPDTSVSVRLDRAGLDARLLEAIGPVGDSVGKPDGPGQRVDHAVARSPTADPGSLDEVQDAAGPARPLSEPDQVGAGGLEIALTADEGQPQDPGVEVEAALAVARDSGDVVYAV